MEVQRTGRPCSGTSDDMQVNHGGGHVTVPEKVLNGAYVGPCFKEVSGK